MLRLLHLTCLAFVSALLSVAASSAFAAAPSRPFVLDMVHHNPGEARYETPYEDPAVIRQMGYNGKVYFLFDSPTLAVDWQSVDPDVFPAGSPGRAWVDKAAARIDAEHTAAKAQGLAVYAMSDLILLPKKLVEKHNLGDTFGDPKNPETEKYLRLLIAQVFERFPRLDGLVVRIGETYLHDAPFHRGKIDHNQHTEKTIIPLAQILRDEICVKRKKQLVFRTWISFDTHLPSYLRVSDAIEPHPNLVFGVKHCENDFHRGNAFSKIIGQGRHPQLIEVQCAREYEGKGAYPNYIVHGVVNGFEEHLLALPPERLRSIGEFARQSPLYAGLWTWTRGGGWAGPYIKNELWCDLNAAILARWALDPKQDEAALFQSYATHKLGLDETDAKKFRRLALLSADAVLRGKSGTRREISPWWSRDDGINQPAFPTDPKARQRVLDQQDEAVAMWREIAGLAREIKFRDAATADYVIVSSDYGLHLYRIYQAFVHLCALGENGDKEALRTWFAAYDSAWADYRKLPAQSAQCATLYREAGAPVGGTGTALQKVIEKLRAAAATSAP
jgi:hypothetical protein